VLKEKDVEAIADQALRERYGSVIGFHVHSILEKGDEWIVDGEVEILHGIFGTERKGFRVYLNREGKVDGIVEEEA
jgi:hypothetical protein